MRWSKRLSSRSVSSPFDARLGDVAVDLVVEVRTVDLAVNTSVAGSVRRVETAPPQVAREVDDLGARGLGHLDVAGRGDPRRARRPPLPGRARARARASRWRSRSTPSANGMSSASASNSGRVTRAASPPERWPACSAPTYRSSSTSARHDGLSPLPDVEHERVVGDRHVDASAMERAQLVDDRHGSPFDHELGTMRRRICGRRTVGVAGLHLVCGPGRWRRSTSTARSAGATVSCRSSARVAGTARLAGWTDFAAAPTRPGAVAARP